MRAPRAGHRRRALLPAFLAVAALAFTACDSGTALSDGPGPTVLVASEVYSRDNTEAQARLQELDLTIDRLRAETGSGWTGRQDDVTGYLADLAGGRFGADAPEATVTAFLDAYGAGLFGVGSGDLDLGTPSGPDVTGATTLRGDQVVDGVPVLDAQLVFTLTGEASSSSLTAVRGRTFPALDVQTTPSVRAGAAARAAERDSGGTAPSTPTLVVVPTGSGTLAWRVAIIDARKDGGISLGDGTYYVDATTGDVIDVRPATAEFGTGTAVLTPVATGAAADGDSVEVTGTDALGEQLTATGSEGSGGVELVDTTLPWYDPATGEGAIETYTAQDTEDVPGVLYVEGGTQVRNPDAIAAHAWSRIVLDYYASIGRESWDGEGGTMVSSVDMGDDRTCNAFFRHDPPMMLYGNPCRGDGGLVQLATLDVAGHEITHGVIESTSGLVYSGQSGALNEAFADYMGNVIGNAHRGTDTSTLGEDACAQVSTAQFLCDAATPEGGWATREMLNGTTYADFLRLLTPNLRTRVKDDYTADEGGVHINSAIWNNALWSIRSRLAQIEGVPGNDSKLATDFDKIVYATLTTQLGPASDFFDARSAIERVAVDAGADPTIIRVAKEVFDQNQICTGCFETGTVNGSIVSAAPQSQIEPAVHGDQVTWVDSSEGGFGFGFPALSGLDGDASALASAPDTVQSVFAGDAVVAVEYSRAQNQARVMRYADGAAEVLAPARDSTLLTGIAGSDDGAAWVSQEQGTISFVDPSGQVTTEDLPGLGGDTVNALGTGSGQVAFGTEGGLVVLWTPGSGFVEVGGTPSTVTSVATAGGRVVAVDDDLNAYLFAEGSDAIQLSTNADRFGVAMNDSYVVWPELVGLLGGALSENEGGVGDTDLYLYSMETGTIYNLLAQTGQQGYPAISGDRLVWQDTVFGNNDIFTALLPDGL